MSKSNENLTPEAKAYVTRLFTCEPPCDSYGVCDHCIEAAIFHAGYNFGFRANKYTDTPSDVTKGGG